MSQQDHAHSLALSRLLAGSIAAVISFSLNDEHEALRSTVMEFARQVVAPVIGPLYERAEFPYEIVAKMGKLGLFGLPFPEEYGGMGGDFFAFCLALHELARVDSSVAITLEAGVALGAMPIFRFGTAEQRERWLPELCRGERLAAFGLTEPGGGSDIPGGMRTTARLDGDTWVINGTKAFITNSGTTITSVITVLAITGRSDDGLQISSIMVPSGTPGLSVGPEYSKVGWCASDTRELSFSDCAVPAANLLGAQGRGYAQFLQTLDEGRVALAVCGRPGSGMRGRVPDVRGAALGVRSPSRPLPVHSVQDRRHAGQGGTSEARLVRRSRPAGGWPAVQVRSRDREAHRVERGDGQRP